VQKNKERSRIGTAMYQADTPEDDVVVCVCGVWGVIGVRFYLQYTAGTKSPQKESKI